MLCDDIFEFCCVLEGVIVYFVVLWVDVNDWCWICVLLCEFEIVYVNDDVVVEVVIDVKLYEVIVFVLYNMMFLYLYMSVIGMLCEYILINVVGMMMEDE